MAMLTSAIISVVAALQSFGNDRLIFLRESESGACLGSLPGPQTHPSFGCMMHIQHHKLPCLPCQMLFALSVHAVKRGKAFLRTEMLSMHVVFVLQSP